MDTGEIVAVMDPQSDCSVEAINDDLSQSSYRSEQLLSEASDVPLPLRRRHWMDTGLRTKLRAVDLACTTNSSTTLFLARMMSYPKPCNRFLPTNSHRINLMCLLNKILSLRLRTLSQMHLSSSIFLSCFLTMILRALCLHNCRHQTMLNRKQAARG